jgi:hypothetical protein
VRVIKDTDCQLKKSCGSNLLCKIISADLISAVKLVTYSAPFNLHLDVDIQLEQEFPRGVMISWKHDQVKNGQAYDQTPGLYKKCSY